MIPVGHAYQIAMATKLHFNSSSPYDATRYNFRGPRMSDAKLKSHYAYHSIGKVSTRVKSHEMCVDWYVGQWKATGEVNLREVNEAAWNKHRAELDQISYTMKSELSELFSSVGSPSSVFDLDPNSGGVILYDSLIAGKISIDTISLLNLVKPLTGRINKMVDGLTKDFYEDISHGIDAYSRYLSLRVRPEIVKNVMKSVLHHTK